MFKEYCYRVKGSLHRSKEYYLVKGRLRGYGYRFKDNCYRVNGTWLW